VSYDSTIIADNPRSFWKFNDAVGSTPASENDFGLDNVRLDNSGGASDFIISATSIGDGENTLNCLHASASQGYVGATPDTISGDHVFSLECWFQIPDTAALYTMMGLQTIGIALEGVCLLVNYPNPGDISLAFGGGNEVSFTPSPALSFNTWYYLVGLKNAAGAISTSNCKIYLNAVAQTLTLTGGGTPNLGNGSSAIPVVGNCYPIGAGIGMKGLVGKPAIYDYALTGAQITTHYNAASAPFAVSAGYITIPLPLLSTKTLTCSGGTPPYAATSSDSSIVAVSGASPTFTLTSKKKGHATVTATDSASGSIGVPVACNGPQVIQE